MTKSIVNIHVQIIDFTHLDDLDHCIIYISMLQLSDSYSIQLKFYVFQHKEASSDAKNVHSASLPPNIYSTSSLSKGDTTEKIKKTKKVTLVEQSTILLEKKKDVELGVSENK